MKNGLNNASPPCLITDTSTEADCRQLHKFGGSSLADAKCYQRVADIISEYSTTDDMIVVSAAGNTTNQLIDWLSCLDQHYSDQHHLDQHHLDQHHLDQQQPLAACHLQQAIIRFQQQLIDQLLEPRQAQQLHQHFSDDIRHLKRLTAGDLNPAVYAEVVGHGEIWSARLLAALLNQRGMPAQWLDARQFLRAARSAQPQIDIATSRPLLRQQLIRHPRQRLVITGFICRDDAGETVLLGRNGSDYSATQIGALAEVDRVTLWSDVAGVYSADPRKVEEACLLPRLRLDEASELARLAASVLHSRTLQPIASSNIDLQLRCSHQPQQGSTRIEPVLAVGQGARIVTSHDSCCLIECQLAPTVDFQHSRQSLLRQLARAGLPPLAVGGQVDRRLLQLCYIDEVADSALAYLQSVQRIMPPASTTSATQHQAPFCGQWQKRDGLAVVALIGAGVCHHPLHCHRFWQQLIDQPVEFISQSEDGISLVAVLRSQHTTRLVQGLHQALFLAKKRVGLVLFGCGNIGSRWLELFDREQASLSARSGCEFVLAGVINSRRSLCDFAGLSPRQALAFFDHQANENSPKQINDWLCRHPYHALVILDLTASQQLADSYLTFARQGFHVISANKLAGASNSEHFRQLRDTFRQAGRHWLYNATVGAGLPVNHSVRDLRQSGDHIIAISGLFSGTLSWLFLQFDGRLAFSKLVEQAWQQGLTEPDPRIDLSGEDVRRKLVILAREAGYSLEPHQVQVESLVPEEAQQGPVAHFFSHCHCLNQQMAHRLAVAQETGMLLRYIARFDASGKARVGLEAVRPEHPLAALLPGDNVFAIESHWYRDNPLIIRGPGAGRDVTAGAIQSDLNQLAQLI